MKMDTELIKMKHIPGGTFMMGSPSKEKSRYEDEGPQHEVTVSDFYMGIYPVTQAQWRFIAQLPEIDQDLKANPSNFTGDNLPVECVSWFDAIEFCKRLSVYMGQNYRLPTEAEWEYACRSGTTTRYSFGNDIEPVDANYCYGSDDDDLEPYDMSGNETSLVGKYAPNAFGLYDMHGNVWEWCLDHWHDTYDGAPKDGSAWIEGGDSSGRVLRGGSWGYFPEDCRSAYRHRHCTDARYNDVGFRVVCCSGLVT